MSDKPINIGTIRRKSGTTKDGEEFEFFEIDLRQDIDLLKNGEKVNFSTYTLDNGVTLSNKRVSVTPVEYLVKKLDKSLADGKISKELYDDIVSGYEKKDVRYVLSVSPRNLA